MVPATSPTYKSSLDTSDCFLKQGAGIQTPTKSIKRKKTCSAPLHNCNRKRIKTATYFGMSTKSEGYVSAVGAEIKIFDSDLPAARESSVEVKNTVHEEIVTTKPGADLWENAMKAVNLPSDENLPTLESLPGDLLSFSSACSVVGDTPINDDTCMGEGGEVISQETVLVSQESDEKADEEEKEVIHENPDEDKENQMPKIMAGQEESPDTVVVEEAESNNEGNATEDRENRALNESVGQSENVEVSSAERHENKSAEQPWSCTIM